MLRRIVGIGSVALLLSTASRAVDDGCWTGGLPAKHQLDWTCVSFSEPFLRGLEGASRADVLEALGTAGRPNDDGGLHFTSNALGGRAFGGNLNVTFNGSGRVRVISALVSRPIDGAEGRDVEFIWNADGRGCSDFPRSLLRCNDEPSGANR